MLEKQMGKLIKATNDGSWAWIQSQYHALLEIHTGKGKIHFVKAAYFGSVPPIGRNTYHPYKMYGIQNIALRGGGQAIQVWVNPTEGKVLDEIGDSHEVLPYFTAILKSRIDGKHLWVTRIKEAFLVEQLKPQRGFQVFKFFGIRRMDLVPDAREERQASLVDLIKKL